MPENGHEDWNMQHCWALSSAIHCCLWWEKINYHWFSTSAAGRKPPKQFKKKKQIHYGMTSDQQQWRHSQYSLSFCDELGTTRLPQTLTYIINAQIFGSKNLWNTSNIKYWHFLEAQHTLNKLRKVSSHKAQSNQPQLKKYNSFTEQTQ
jgi:hypothetical protein